MRYTRYDYKKNKGDNFFLWLIGIIIFSICIGVFFYNVFLKDNTIINDSKKNEMIKSEEKVSEECKEFGIIQCGVFKSKENADATLNSINSEKTCFIVEEDNSFKIIYGIYLFDDATNKSEELTKKSITNFRFKCSMNDGNNEKKVESEIIDAYIKIINKLFEKDVKSVNTKEFKEWVVKISENVESRSEEFNGLISNIGNLPDEYTKDNQKESLILLYNILAKYKQK